MTLSGRRPHPLDCPCVVCNPARCAACGQANPYLRDGVCRDRRPCEARQMLNDGVPIEHAVRHAQGLTS